MLRVLTLSTLYPDRDRPVHGTFVERQTQGLAAHPDVELQVVVPRGLPSFPLSKLSRYRDLAALPKTEMWNGLTVHRPRFLHLPKIGARRDSAMMVRVLTPLLRSLRESFPFDVIDAEYFFPDGPTAVALGRQLGVPVSIKARGSDIHLWGKRADTGAQVIAAGQAADGMLAVSAALKADMAALGMPDARINVHYTGVDLDLFKLVDRAEAKAAVGKYGPLIVALGTLQPRKGHDLVIAALAAIPDAELVIIGAGPDRERLLARASALGVAERVALMGSQSRENVAKWLAAADVMALASASEGLANAWVEALASGTPVVTCDVGGAREIITSQTAGRLVPRDAIAVAAAINAILADPPAREAVRAHAAHFTWEANTAALYAHLRGLVGPA
jgi:glycosyltransferase involved in cell wall biosynthesis